MKDIREARNKLAQLQICKMKDIYEYICEFSNWYYDVFDSNMNMRILVNIYYENYKENGVIISKKNMKK